MLVLVDVCNGDKQTKNDDINLTTILKVGATHLVEDWLWSFDFIQIFE